MDSILEQISGGDFSPLENDALSTGVQAAQLAAFEKFRACTANFSAEQTRELENMVEAHLDYMEMQVQEAYTKGFCHGARVLLEILQK